MSEGFRRGLKLLVGGPRPQLPAPEAPQELTSRAGLVRIQQLDGQVHLQPSFRPEAMLVLPGRIDGTLESVPGAAGGREATLLTLPVRVGGRSRKLKLTVARQGARSPDEEFALVRSSRRRVPPSDQALEFVYRLDASEVRYLVEMDLEIPPVAFREFTRNLPEHAEVPPVSQMTAFLQATLHQRRTALRSLASLARRVEDRPVQAMVALMQETLSPSQDFSNPVLTELAVDLQRVGRPINPNTLAAMTLLADIYLGNLSRARLDELIERGIPLETSLTAAEAAAEFLGVEPEGWRLIRPPRPEGVDKSRAFLQSAVGQRTAMTILADLAEDSGSERSRSRVERLQARVKPDQVLANDEHEALRAYLSNLGRPVQLHTLAALGVYVDFEAGIVSEEDIDALTPSRGFLDTSLYAMLAISGAFDAELRPFRLMAERQALLWEGLMQLLRVTRGGLIARFLEPSQPGVLTLCVSSPAEVVPLRSRGLTFTGEILAKLPILDSLTPGDLEVMARANPGLMACFESEDRSVQWRRLDSVHAFLAEGNDYIEGYRRYRFNGKVVARLQGVSPDELRWRKDFLSVYRDLLGHAHYVFCARFEEMRPPRPELEWADEVVEFPDLAGCPPKLLEPTHEFLLGQPEERGLRQQRLDRIYEGLEAHLTQPWSWHDLAQHPPHLERLRSKLRSSSVRAALAGVVDLSTRNALVEALCEPSTELELAEPLLQSLDLAEMEELAVLLVLFKACQELELPGGQRKYYHHDLFRELLLDRLFALGDSSDPVVRLQAARLMGSELVAYAAQQQLAVSYVLSRFLESEKPTVARQAARSLAALALEELVALPQTTRVCQQGDLPQDPREPTGQDEELEEIRSELDAWLQSSDAPLSPLAALLRDSDRSGALCEWVSRLNGAFRADASLDRHRFLMVVTAERLERFLSDSLGSWQEFASQRGCSLSDLLQGEDVPRLVSDFRLWAENRDAYLENLALVHLGPGETCAVRARGRLAPLFGRIAEEPEARLVRWLPPSETARALATQPEQLTYRGRVYADELLVFDAARKRFGPLFEQEPLAGLTLRPEEPLPLARPRPAEGGAPSLTGLAVTVMGVFNIPADSLPLVQTMLAGLMPRHERVRLSGRE